MMRGWKKFLSWIAGGPLIAPPARHVDIFARSFANGSGFLEVIATPSIPSGKRLFLQSIHMQSPVEARLTIGPGPIAHFWVNMVHQGTFRGGTAQSFFAGSQDLDIPLNSGESLTLFMSRNDSLGDASHNFATATIVGYLVDDSLNFASVGEAV
jgi:hypothetical protein